MRSPWVTFSIPLPRCKGRLWLPLRNDECALIEAESYENDRRGTGAVVQTHFSATPLLPPERDPRTAHRRASHAAVAFHPGIGD